jgi:hypothetical protein
MVESGQIRRTLPEFRQDKPEIPRCVGNMWLSPQADSNDFEVLTTWRRPMHVCKTDAQTYIDEASTNRSRQWE